MLASLYLSIYTDFCNLVLAKIVLNKLEHLSAGYNHLSKDRSLPLEWSTNKAPALPQILDYGGNGYLIFLNILKFSVNAGLKRFRPQQILEKGVKNVFGKLQPCRKY